MNRHHLAILAVVGTSMLVGIGPATSGAPRLCLASSVGDKQVAAALARRVQSAYAVTNPKAGALRIVVRPACNGDATLDIYEVTDSAAIRAVEAHGKSAQASVSGAGTLTLRFFEREVWDGPSRGKERLLHRAVVQAPRSPG